MALVDLEETRRQAATRIATFAPVTQALTHQPRGVRASELFFVYAATAAIPPPRQILESGRARGQSTYLLGRCFPDTPVISVDVNPDHPDAQPALDYVRALPNVACLVGNGRRVLPELTLPGDVVVIDGPKEMRALRLAMHLLKVNRASLVFLHDCAVGTRIRRYLERHVPAAFFSDDAEFQEHYGWLDRYLKRSDDGDVEGGELETFACLPADGGFPHALDRVRVRLERWRAMCR